MPQSSTGSSERLLDDCLLCSTQIVDCLAWLEQAIRVEIAQQCVLSVSIIYSVKIYAYNIALYSTDMSTAFSRSNYMVHKQDGEFYYLAS